ncbi:MAG: TIGR03086 family metal-binding protein [Actinomycetota bacterium]
MSQNLRSFTEAIYAFDAVVSRIGADNWDASTACEGWTARDLVEHQCAVINGVSGCAETGEMVAPTPSDSIDDPVVMWRASRDRVLAALDQPGVLQQQGPFWFKTETIDDLIGIVMWDPTTHAWDLAWGQDDVDHALNPALVERVMATVEPMMPMLVKSGRTGESVDLPANASVVDRYIAMVGRNPS